jgi:hypothetical protein
MNHTLNFTTEELNLMLGALGELPAKASMNLIMSIQRQASADQPEPTVVENVPDEE